MKNLFRAKSRGSLNDSGLAASDQEEITTFYPKFSLFLKVSMPKKRQRRKGKDVALNSVASVHCSNEKKREIMCNCIKHASFPTSFCCCLRYEERKAIRRARNRKEKKSPGVAPKNWLPISSQPISCLLLFSETINKLSSHEKSCAAHSERYSIIVMIHKRISNSRTKFNVNLKNVLFGGVRLEVAKECPSSNYTKVSTITAAEK